MQTRDAADLLIALDRTSKTPCFMQIYQHVRRLIEKGALREGWRLPSVRTLARSLDVSHITVENAYMQLKAEGYIRSKRGSGYEVEAIDVSYFEKERASNASAIEAIAKRWEERATRGADLPLKPCRYDFSYYELPRGSFPQSSWAAFSRTAALDADPDLLCRYPSRIMPNRLQRALAEYLHRTRGVVCQPEQVMVAAASEGALGQILSLFDPATDRIGHEEPGWPIMAEAASDQGFAIVPVASDRGPQAYLDAIYQGGPRLVFATPSHQYPTGGLMGLETRIELLRMAAERDFYIIEDDSCNEYRYRTSPIPSLQSLDKSDRVIYLGNFSKVLSPGLRVAYFVLPPALLERYSLRYPAPFSSVSILLQETLARFIEDGFMDRQVRLMTASMRKRHDALLRCIEGAFGETIRLSGVDSGMHFLATVRNGMGQQQLQDSALEQDARIYRTEHLWFSHDAPPDQVMIGFSSIDVDDIGPGVEALRRAWLS